MSGGKVWVVTGASRGIGASIARVAFESGDRVALIARGESVLTLAANSALMPWGCNVMWRTQSRCLPPWMR